MRRGIVAGIIGIVMLLGMVGQLWAQTSDRVFPNGLKLDNEYGFQAFWEAHDGATMLGAPVTGLIFEGNVPVQYFEQARLERRDDSVVLGALGRERSRWRSLPTLADDGDSARFRRFWEAHEGALLLGEALGGPLWEASNGVSVRVQYFEHGRLEVRTGFGANTITVGAVGRETALAKGLLIPSSVALRALPDVQPARAAAFGALLPSPTPLPTSTPLPTPTAEPDTPALPSPAAPVSVGKVIDVNISTQSLAAYEDGALVYQAWVATGKDGFNTPAGTFDVYSKTRMQTMTGSMGGENWVVPDVPHVMYIDGSVALHGTYWHDLFGSGIRMSHGCVNLSLPDAAWLYEWAPTGTTVVVHY